MTYAITFYVKLLHSCASKKSHGSVTLVERCISARGSTIILSATFRREVGNGYESYDP